jgi:site-specific DNA-methyltransferase (adenine-specific)
MLGNGMTVRLIGIKQDPKINGKATEFLLSKFKGNKVFLKYDDIKYDANNHLMVYMYLENKTFINAHMLKNRLALVDESIDYKYKTKFLSYGN